MRHISGFGTFYLIDAFFLFVCFLFCVRILVHGGLTLFFYSTTLFSPVSFFVQRRVSIADCNGRILHDMVFALQRLSAQSSFFRFPLSRFLLRPFFVTFRSLRADSSAVYLFVLFCFFNVFVILHVASSLNVDSCLLPALHALQLGFRCVIQVATIFFLYWSSVFVFPCVHITYLQIHKCFCVASQR